MNLRLFASMFVLWSALWTPLPAIACPLCKEAISTPNGDDEVNNLPAAYNNSIYLMIGVPYASLGLIGFVIYRGVQKNAAFFENLQSPSDEIPKGDQDAR